MIVKSMLKAKMSSNRYTIEGGCKSLGDESHLRNESHFDPALDQEQQISTVRHTMTQGGAHVQKQVQ